MATKTIVTPEFPDGKVITLTSEEEAVLKAEQDADAPKVVERDQMVEDQKNLKASAKNKLMNGEALTEDEANVMVGL